MIPRHGDHADALISQSANPALNRMFNQKCVVVLVNHVSEHQNRINFMIDCRLNCPVPCHLGIDSGQKFAVLLLEAWRQAPWCLAQVHITDTKDLACQVRKPVDKRTLKGPTQWSILTLSPPI